MNNDANLARLLQAIFTDRLMQQRQASPHTIASYRDTFCLLLRFIQRRTNKAPNALSLADMDAPIILKKSVEFNPAENIQHKFDKPIGGMS